jgi:glycosyltransferase involved in cell wall biosynthesis
LETLKNKLGLEACVQFAGHLPNASVWALMKKAAVFVSLSAYEGCPNSVMEAMACGCPLVLSDIPAHREILDESLTLFVDPINVQVVAAAIAQTLDDQDASKGRAFIAKQKSKRWSVEKAARDYEKVYEEVISQHSMLVNKGRKSAFGKGDPL